MRRLTDCNPIWLVVITVAVSVWTPDALAADRGAIGPHVVTTVEYGSTIPVLLLAGDDPGHEIEVQGEVTYPVDLSQEPFPLVVHVHG